MKRIKVLIAEDHSVVRSGLKILLEMANDVEVVGEAQDGNEAVRSAKRLRPDVVLMDLAMPKMNGMEATRQIQAESPGSKVLVLSSYSNDELVTNAMDHGARGYLVKQSAAQDLLQGIREVSQGRPFFSPSIARRLKALEGNLTNGGVAKRKRANQLTPREREVLKLIAEGHCNKQIADLLKVSIKTTEKHRQAMMNKLNIHETAGLTRYACERGFVAGVGNSPDQQLQLLPLNQGARKGFEGAQ